MIDADRRLATLAAVFAPARAAAMLARLGTTGAREASTHALGLAAASRHDRLQALSSIFTRDPASVRARLDAASRLERPRIARLMYDLGVGPCAVADASPIVVRLCVEQLGR